MRTKGFTLIELLIVVAIIAILAAIAVPNFLEAQVRAKVSRSKSDLRTITTGIEAYAVDYTKSMPGPPSHTPSHTALNRLTTPVAYLASVPQDVFREKGGVNKNTGTSEVKTGYEYAWTFDGITGLQAAKVAYGRGYTWILGGAGPARNYAFPTMWGLITGTGNPKPGHTVACYDPSNGTISEGWIVRTNKGEWQGDTTK